MRALLFLAFLFAAGSAAAQPASLVADSVRIEADQVLVAEGNVEVFYEEARLSASRIIYDGETEELTVEGPVRITEGDGDVVLIGDTAELEPGLRDGILTGARLVLSQQVQIAADELASIGDGRYRRLTNVVASSCRVCAQRPTPLWEIRARRVLHDTVERQMYFTRAQFRVLGVPVMYIPRLRLPDPTVVRARGFLPPQWKGGGDIGQGPLVPYFIPLGPSADVTVAPWLTPNARTVELRYRQEFRSGSLIVQSAFSRDDLRPGETRSYVDAQGRFRLPRDFRLAFDIERASDDEYADAYDYNTSSRLESRLGVYRYRQDELIDAWLSTYQILRPGSLDAADRNLVNIGDAEFRRVFPSRFGQIALDIDGDIYDRDSDQEVTGRDVGRLGTTLGWSAGTVLARGFLLDAEAEVRADAYAIRNDPDYDSEAFRVTPAVAVGLRWPLVRARGGVAESLEPVAQLVWADVSGADVPDEDSRVVDFDEGNLFTLDRYPGSDQSETGTRLNLGLAYSRMSPGWEFNGYVGRIFRPEETDQFDPATGLDGEWSDWLVSGQVGMNDWLTATNRAVFDDSFDVARNEFRLALEAGAADFATSYLWLEAEPEIDRPEDVHEAIFTAAYEFNRHWLGGIETRWDIIDERLTETDFDVTYRNECLSVDLYVSRRYDSASSVDPTYNFGIEVSLAGFGGGDTSRYARSCPG